MACYMPLRISYLNTEANWRHFDEILNTSCRKGCHTDNCLSSQWWKHLSFSWLIFVGKIGTQIAKLKSNLMGSHAQPVMHTPSRLEHLVVPVEVLQGDNEGLRHWAIIVEIICRQLASGTTTVWGILCSVAEAILTGLILGLRPANEGRRY